MPIFEYRCHSCGNVYEIFHKVREIAEDVICPSCRSTSYTRLISAPMVKTESAREDFNASCSTGCCGGSCGIN